MTAYPMLNRAYPESMVFACCGRAQFYSALPVSAPLLNGAPHLYRQEWSEWEGRSVKSFYLRCLRISTMKWTIRIELTPDVK
jgi:hypothetical protein